MNSLKKIYIVKEKFKYGVFFLINVGPIAQPGLERWSYMTHRLRLRQPENDFIRLKVAGSNPVGPTL